MRPSFLSNKTYTCSLCGQESTGNIDTTCQITCWRCVNFFLAASQEKIKALHKRLLEQGATEKAKLVHKWISEEKPDDKQCGRGVQPQQRRSR